MHVRSTAAVLLVGITVLQLAACSKDPNVEKVERFERGKALAAQGRHDHAILEFRNALAADPNYGDAHRALAHSYERTSDVPNAYRSYQRAADLLPNDIEAQLDAARFLLEARQFIDARPRAERAVQIDPKNAQAHIVLGSALAGMRDVRAAVDQIQQAIDLAPADSSGYTRMGALLLTDGRRDEALAQFEKAVAADPKSIDARIALATYFWSTGDTTRTEEIIGQALAIDPESPFANRVMAMLLLTSRRIPQAEPFLKKAVAGVGTIEAELPLADYYLRTSRFADARAILDRAAGKGSASASIKLATLDYAEGHRDRAHERIDTLLGQQPGNSEALIVKGRWLFREGRLEEALLRAEAATQYDPGNAAAFLLLGDVRAAARTGDAAGAYRQALQRNPRIAAANTALSRLNLAERNPASAVEFARGALVTEPANDEARLLLAKGLLAQGDLRRAEEETQLLLSRRPDHPAVLALKASVSLHKGDAAGARLEFERALAKDPVNIDALSGLTSIELAEGRIAEARTRLMSAIVANGDDPDLRLLAAGIDFQAGDFASGEAHARAVIARDPTQTRAYELLGMAYVQQQKLPAALAEFEGLLVRQPQSVATLTTIGMIHEAMAQPHDAEKAYQRALLVDPRAIVAANNLAYLLAKRGDNLEYALVLAREAAAAAQDDPVILDTLGWVYLKKGQPAQAIVELTKAARLAPANATYHYHLGLAYAEAKEPAKARAALEQALRINPNFQGADDARSRLRSLSQ